MRQILSYDKETGEFVWKVTLANKAPAGAVAGHVHKKSGCIHIGINRKIHKAHRLAVLYMTGEWPAGEVDHRNGRPADNRWENLRDVPHAINMQNFQRARTTSKTGILGVSPANGGFKAQITTCGHQKNLGIYATAEEAYAVYLAAKRRLHEGNTL